MKKILPLLLWLVVSANVTANGVDFNYISPVPGSLYINPEQVLILKTGYCYDPGSLPEVFVLIKGSESGFILSELFLSGDLKTLFIRPFSKFSLGEEVHVYISPGLRTTDGKNITSTGFHFQTREHNIPLATDSPGSEYEFSLVHDDQQLSRSRSTEYSGRDNNLPPDYPAPTYVFTGDGASEGYIFFTPTVRLTSQYEKYLTIWDNYGVPIFYKKVNKTVTDFKVLGDSILTYAVNGLQNPALDCYYLMDGNYDIFDSVRAGNGYYIDNHDIILLQNGHFLILIYDQQVINMSLVVPGGDPNALVTGLVIQEVDLNQNVYFQWRSWDHYQITDATWDIDLTAHWIDYVHANAIDLDSDGNILVSCRHLDEITKINFTTGNIIWRLGLNAVNNQFTFTNDPIGFSHQHDIRKLANGNYTVYDNGNLHITQLSRALEYQLNEATMQATLVWDYQHDPNIYAPLTGSNRRMPNNNRLIGWGANSPIGITEVNSNNQVVLEFNLPDSVTGYRALKDSWETTMFSTEPNVSFGNYEGYSSPKEYLLHITNNYSQTIQINSTYNHLEEIFFVSNIPLSIPSGGSADIAVFFQPQNTGNFQDILTLNYDNVGNTRRIARQLKLSGLWNPALPSLQFDPASGTINVDPNASVVVTFSEPVRKIFGTELDDDDVPFLFKFQETNLYGPDVAFHGTVSPDKKVIQIIPDETLLEQQQYFIKLKPNVLEDYDGNVIYYSDFCFFTTGNAVKINEEGSSGRILIYPNPAASVINIFSEKDIRKIEIFNLEGKLIYSEFSSGRSLEINSDNIPSGLLTIRLITTDGKQVIRRIVKE